MEAYARYIYAFFRTKKIITVKGLWELNNLVYNQTGRYISSLMINGGKEFSIKELTKYIKLVGMNILYIAPYTSK